MSNESTDIESQSHGVGRAGETGPAYVPRIWLLLVRWSGEVHDFALDDYTRWRLLEGLDDIGLTLRHTELVNAYESTRKPWLPPVPV